MSEQLYCAMDVPEMEEIRLRWRYPDESRPPFDPYNVLRAQGEKDVTRLLAEVLWLGRRLQFWQKLGQDEQLHNIYLDRQLAAIKRGEDPSTVERPTWDSL